MIHGITDRPRYFPRVGKIRLGVRDAQRGYPKDMDHFVVADLPEVAKVYGDRPKSIIIAFPSNEVEQVFPTRLEHWKSRKAREGDAVQRSTLFCSSDGVTANRLYIGQERDPQGHAIVMKMPADDRPDPMEMFQMPCPHEDCPYFEDRSCKRVGRLTFILPEVGFAGVYQIETSSMYGFGNILDTLSWVKALSVTPAFPTGRLVGAFFELSREPQSMTIPDTGKVAIKHVLTLRVITAPDRIRGLAGKVPPWLLGGPGVKQIAAAADVPEELFPESVRGAIEAPAVPDPGVVEDLDSLRKLSGMGKAQFEMLCAQMGGDVEKIRAFIQKQIDDMEEAIPLSEGGGAPSKPMPKEPEKPAAKSVLADW